MSSALLKELRDTEEKDMEYIIKYMNEDSEYLAKMVLLTA